MTRVYTHIVFLFTSLVAAYTISVVAIAQQKEPLVETFDGGWRSGIRTVKCMFDERSHELDVRGGDARLILDGEYKPPLHIRYSPASVLYIYEDGENGISGAAFDFENNEMVKRDFVPGKSKSTPYSDRISCTTLE